MRKMNTISGLSLVIILLPFLGLPQFFDDLLYIAFGITIFVLTFLLRKNSYVQRKSVSDESEIRPESKQGDTTKEIEV